MRISDWSSDVCSSDLKEIGRRGFAGGVAAAALREERRERLRRALRRGVGRGRFDNQVRPSRSAIAAGGAAIELQAREQGRSQARAVERSSRQRRVVVVVAGQRRDGVAQWRHVVDHAARDRKSTRLNSSPYCATRMPSSACKKKIKTTKTPLINLK